MENIEEEIWKDVVWPEDFTGYYQVSNMGRVRSVDRKVWNRFDFITKKGALMIPDCNQRYMKVRLSKEHKYKKVLIHLLVGHHFVDNPNNLPEINHEDGIRFNCKYTNLKWCTHSDNMKHAFRTGLNKAKKGESNWQAKLTDKKVLEIRRLYATGKYSHRQLSKMFNANNIGNIINKKMWNHI